MDLEILRKRGGSHRIARHKTCIYSHIFANKILLVSKRTDNTSYKIISLKLPLCINRCTNNIIVTSWILKLRAYTSLLFQSRKYW